MATASLHVETNRDQSRIRIEGALDLAHFNQAKKALAKSLAACGDDVTIDAAQIDRFDTAGALLLRDFTNPTQKTTQHITLINLRPAHESLFKLVAGMKQEPLPMKRPPADFTRIVEQVGKASVDIWEGTIELITFTGQAGIALGKAVLSPARLRFASISRHIEEIGIHAIPIISLIAFLISIILAYQGRVQLRPLGAEQYTVNLIAISVLREMGVLLTAIMVAGRSGSAFTAEIGVMKLREEIDALRTIGFDPFELLVVPRLIAILIALPLLTFIADIMGLLGGGIISSSLMDISLPQYMARVRTVATGHDLLVGLIKAPVFALAIGLVGCLHGLKVSGSSQSVGKETTASVVKAIFLVLMLDGLFSIYFQKVGL